MVDLGGIRMNLKAIYCDPMQVDRDYPSVKNHLLLVVMVIM